MPTMELRNSIIQLVKDTAEAHQKEFTSSRGTDPDWPIWFAERMQQPLEQYETGLVPTIIGTG